MKIMGRNFRTECLRRFWVKFRIWREIRVQGRNKTTVAKTFLLAGTILTMISVANADLILTLNGLDAAKEPLESK